MSKERVDECHRAVTRFVVKGLHPFATVESPSFRYAKCFLDKVLNFSRQYQWIFACVSKHIRNRANRTLYTTINYD